MCSYTRLSRKQRNKMYLDLQHCNFHGVNTPAVVNFKLQTACLTQGAWSREEVKEHQGQK